MTETIINIQICTETDNNVPTSKIDIYQRLNQNSECKRFKERSNKV
jgi:hypothetical protein